MIYLLFGVFVGVLLASVWEITYFNKNTRK